MRPSKIEFAPRVESAPIFNFWMGKNMPERKDYIMDSLVVPVEEEELEEQLTDHSQRLETLARVAEEELAEEVQSEEREEEHLT